MRFLRRMPSLLSSPRSPRPGIQLRLEELEPRTVPTTTGNAWPHPEHVTLSFAPDGTVLGTNANGNVYSNLFAKFNGHPGWTTATWENQVLTAAQTWAQYTNLNFDVVADSGAGTGAGSYQQGDPQFGDVRFGGYSFGNSYVGSAFLPPPVNNYSIAGDINFNTGLGFNIGTTYDLYSVALHEIGHAIGMGHSTSTSAAMYATYNGVKHGLGSDDITVLQSIYGARQPDAYDAAAANNTFGTATNLTAQINPTTLTSVQNNLDITTTSDADYYTFTVPSGTSGTFTLQVQTQGLSLLRQAVTVYASNETTVLGSASAAGAYDGTTQTVTVSGVTAGQVLYVKVAGADTTAFGTGRYAMTLNFGTGANPAVQLPNTLTANGTPLQGGGSQTNQVPQLNMFNIPGYEALGVAHSHHHATKPTHHHATRPTHHHAATHHGHHHGNTLSSAVHNAVFSDVHFVNSLPG